MPRPVVRGRTDISFKAVAEALTHNDVTAVPVVDDIGRPVDVVSQAELVRKVARRPDPAGPVRLPEPTDRSAGGNVTVEELDDALPEEMSRDVLVRMPGLAPTDMTVHVEEGQVHRRGPLGQSAARSRRRAAAPGRRRRRLGRPARVRPRRPRATSNPSAGLAPSTLQPGTP
ncbi:CBS domain-containing protein [Streptomyces tendae]|uniref:CBS domain-containing protein n=1 Tax=Streptomyces tendae TaxID=1932 RepID=UPI0036AA3A76